jgi:hypothetical protein
MLFLLVYAILDQIQIAKKYVIHFSLIFILNNESIIRVPICIILIRILDDYALKKTFFYTQC